MRLGELVPRLGVGRLNIGLGLTPHPPFHDCLHFIGVEAVPTFGDELGDLGCSLGDEPSEQLNVVVTGLVTTDADGLWYEASGVRLTDRARYDICLSD